MKVTDVRIRLVDGQSRLKAVADITFDDCFVVHDIRVIEGENGVFIAMPSKHLPNGKHRDIAHPINTEIRGHIEEQIKDSYQKVIETTV